MRVNSYSVFGDNRENWTHNIATNLRQHYTLYPDWTFWLFTDREFDPNVGYGAVVHRLAQEGLIKLTIVPDGGQEYQQRSKTMMMLWRLIPIWENTEYVFCRDLDSILTPRQLQCVRSFIANGAIAHGINDNAGHDIPLMGGMCGFKSAGFRSKVRAANINALVKGKYSAATWRSHGTDQNFLTQYVWPYVSSSAVIHRLEGPNYRGDIKKVTDADISDIPEAIRQRGDEFTNYIGAPGTITQNGLFNNSNQSIAEFYNEYGNKEKCSIITKIEKELNVHY